MKPFSLLVKPASADCNLRCEYCFYLGKCGLYPDSRVHRMSDEILDRMIRTFMLTGQPIHSFGWQGGEPTLMGLDFFRRVTELQTRYGRPGATVANGLQTNGTLIDDGIAEHLARYRFLVGVSVDGPPEIHDRYRITADGRGSHALAAAGIEALRRHKAEFNVLTLVSRSNVDRPSETYRHLCDLGVMYHQYIECVEFDNSGRLMPFAIRPEEWGDFLCGIYDSWIGADTRRVSVRLFDTILAQLVDGVSNVCTFGSDCRQYLVVEHNGDVYPCDFFVEPELRLGNVMTHGWSEMLGSEACARFGERKRLWNRACDGCPYLPLCRGDCPKNRGPERGNPHTLSWLCGGWKRFFEHSLPGFERLAAGIREDRIRAAIAGREALKNRSTTPVGRNDPCPCGSGLKYKRCCGRA